jgi:HAD superfamily phosphatase (TIGR01668 family)
LVRSNVNKSICVYIINRVIKTNQKSILYPDYVAASVLELKADELKKAGITHLAFDIDETVVPKKHHKLDKKYTDFIKQLTDRGFTILIASNSTRDLSKFVKDMRAVLVPVDRLTYKPFKKYFERVVQFAKTDRKHIAMVGDKIINDIIGANRAGLTTILVEPYARRQKKHIKYYFDRALRRDGSNAL